MPDMAAPSRRWATLTSPDAAVYFIMAAAIVGIVAAIVIPFVVTAPSPTPSLMNLELPDGRTLECVTFEGTSEIISCDWANASK